MVCPLDQTRSVPRGSKGQTTEQKLTNILPKQDDGDWHSYRLTTRHDEQAIHQLTIPCIIGIQHVIIIQNGEQERPSWNVLQVSCLDPSWTTRGRFGYDTQGYQNERQRRRWWQEENHDHLHHWRTGQSLYWTNRKTSIGRNNDTVESKRHILVRWKSMVSTSGWINRVASQVSCQRWLWQYYHW